MVYSGHNNTPTTSTTNSIENCRSPFNTDEPNTIRVAPNELGVSPLSPAPGRRTGRRLAKDEDSLSVGTTALSGEPEFLLQLVPGSEKNARSWWKCRGGGGGVFVGGVKVQKKKKKQVSTSLKK